MSPEYLFEKCRKQNFYLHDFAVVEKTFLWSLFLLLWLDRVSSKLVLIKHLMVFPCMHIANIYERNLNSNQIDCIHVESLTVCLFVSLLANHSKITAGYSQAFRAHPTTI